MRGCLASWARSGARWTPGAHARLRGATDWWAPCQPNKYSYSDPAQQAFLHPNTTLPTHFSPHDPIQNSKRRASYSLPFTHIKGSHLASLTCRVLPSNIPARTTIPVSLFFFTLMRPRRQLLLDCGPCAVLYALTQAAPTERPDLMLSHIILSAKTFPVLNTPSVKEPMIARTLPLKLRSSAQPPIPLKMRSLATRIPLAMSPLAKTMVALTVRYSLARSTTLFQEQIPARALFASTATTILTVPSRLVAVVTRGAIWIANTTRRSSRAYAEIALPDRTS